MVDDMRKFKVLGTKHKYHVLKVDTVTADGIRKYATVKTNESAVLYRDDGKKTVATVIEEIK